MGVGKSAVGRHVSKALGLHFVDSDAVIEEHAGKPITRIFAEEGEPRFRELERWFVEHGHPSSGQVVACGGGLVIPTGMRELLLSKGVVVCLFAQPETILQRTMASDKRPLLNVEDSSRRIRELLEQRMPIYMQTGVGICAEGRTLTDVMQNVVRVYRRESRRLATTRV
ncbi:MAG: shikimate kinase [Verrucomicrobiota bacterium JB022]|nr:shikimate kinase [Verrucomicrobiota bacterium JB022]